eukprot:TRINITY_DN2085_c0_g1_i2.p1 TRINITY_DN2085_c0_g1~~TRINITY_DN2085_c0_g1_i2.p1  ORF type:complete len:559 (+),score=75.78 TRINITY_DN2085_c0_g1_i2:95-1771(+)
MAIQGSALFFVCICYITLAPACAQLVSNGPPDPETDPAVIKFLLPDNQVVGGPYADYLRGERIWFKTVYFWGKGGADTFDTQTTNDVIWGADGDDSIYAEDGNDTIMGGPGNDLLIGAPGRDIIYGEDGNDTVLGDPCGIGNTCVGPQVVYNDWIHGGPGNDILNGMDANDEIYGGTGDDRLFGGKADDFLSGDEGNDALFGDDASGVGNDYLLGGPGNDTLYGDYGTDIIYGGPGIDILKGGGGRTVFVLDAQPCGETDDVRYFIPANGHTVVVVAGAGSTGSAILKAGVKAIQVTTVHHVTGVYVPGCAVPIATFLGVDIPPGPIAAVLTLQAAPPPPPSWVVGMIPMPVPGQNGVPNIPPDNIMQGTSFNDNLYGVNNSATFSNYMFGLNLNDLMVGGMGPDFIVGNGHDDSIFGGDGDDRLSGGSGYDVIHGEGGRDALFGGHNIDILYGGGLGNWITGGDSIDHIYVDAPSTCPAPGGLADVITDYDGDMIYIVGTITSVQLSAGSSGTTNVALPGCSTPFLVVNSTTGLTVQSSHISFVKPGTVPSSPVAHT